MRPAFFPLLRRLLPGRIRRFARRVRHAAAVRRAVVETTLAWRARARRRRPHGLPAPLVVSLTSYPPRYGTLALTLKCLLSQRLRADRTVLWLSEADAGALPAGVRALAAAGLEIRLTPDIRSYKKIIPSLHAFPGAFVATADDDLYYGPDWLGRLVAAYDPARPTVICYRAHRVRVDGGGRPLPYAEWEYEVPERDTSPDLFPTGVGGVLYFPGALPRETLDEARFLALAPGNDDVWLYWMERLAGTSVTTLGHRRPLVLWPGSQQVALFKTNTGVDGENDAFVSRLFAAYGLPLPLPPPPPRSR